MTELKPCPFCGGSVSMVLNQFEGSYMVFHNSIEPCLVCEPFEIAMNAVVKNREDAIRAWNRRSNDAEIH